MGQGIVFPSDAGVIDVTAFGAVPDDGMDDWQAIQDAMDSVSLNASGGAIASGANNAVLYFPDGQYDLSDMLVYPGRQKRLILQGQSRDGVTLRLQDNRGWTAADAKSVLRTGSGTADRFRNAVRDMTISIGSNNPNASGLQFFASNQGTVNNVRITSDDGAGASGLDMAWDDAIGPLLIEDVVVEGFDYGVDTRWQTASQTFTNITVRDQNQAGFRNRNNQTVFINGFTSEQQTNAVPALQNLSNSTEAVVLADATITAAGGTSNAAAIVNQRALFVARASVEGYDKSIANDISNGRGNADSEQPFIEEYIAVGAGGPNFSGPAISVFDSPNRSLRLPVKETPEVAWETDLAKWAGPHQFGGNPNDNIDDTAAIQAAIDSGATTIYLPNGDWTVNGQIDLGGNVERFMGTEARMSSSTGTGSIVVGDGAADTVVIERFDGGLNDTAVKIFQDTERTLVLNSLVNFRYQTDPDAEDPGDLFLNDFGGRVIFRDQDVWARQLNTEQDTEQDAGQPVPSQDARIINDGGNVWLLGVKTEKDGTVVKTINGGATELLGTFHAGSGRSETDPRFETIDSSFSAAVYTTQVGGSGGFDLFARETRNGETRTVNLPSGPTVNLYTAFAFTEGIDEPEVWYRGDGNADDASGFGHFAQPADAVAYADGIEGQAFAFNGADAVIDITTGVLEQVVNERTVAMWVRPDDLQATQTLFDEGGMEGGFSLLLSNGFVLAVATDGTTVDGAQALMPTGQAWTHLAMTFDQGVIELYVDGQVADVVTTDVSQVPWHAGDRSALGASLDSNVLVAAGGSGDPFAGLIDDFRLWGVALDASTIQSLAQHPGDFNGNGELDAGDIDLLYANLGDASFDLTGDGLSDQSDVDLLVLDSGFVNTFFGDANLDGSINGSDLAILAANFGASGTPSWSLGNFNGDASINGSDLAILAANFGLTAPATAADLAFALDQLGISQLAEVPEPASITVLMLLLVGLERRPNHHEAVGPHPHFRLPGEVKLTHSSLQGKRR